MFVLNLSSHPNPPKEWNITVLTHLGCTYLLLLQRLCAFEVRHSQSGRTDWSSSFECWFWEDILWARSGMNGGVKGTVVGRWILLT